MKKAIIFLFGLVSLITSWGAAGLAMENEVHPSFASVGSLTSIPVGHAEYCQRRPHDCQITDLVRNVALEEEFWRELQEVNNHYNISIMPVSDRDLYGVDEFWTYPVNGYGDCEDFALGKRAALIERGWPPSTLLVAVATQPNGDGHAVLMVRTDRGDLILDNQEALIKVWTDTPYTYLKRQSQANAGQWVDILDGVGGNLTATAGY
ncbi:transglutaminase-like cysteine peptidase [Pelagibacterium halotolerans]|nr:transglutaminase-like cysteine peptidase [Pelagibacterium halotolerans]QJR17500.1 transglutaminase-like cysteine peptidase [Pelagibacterium halotolerans]SEA75633.1 Predicted transglutaminase-like cysteine proteinase [Pelagibacterium halotolerans]